MSLFLCSCHVDCGSIPRLLQTSFRTTSSSLRPSWFGNFCLRWSICLLLIVSFSDFITVVLIYVNVSYFVMARILGLVLSEKHPSMTVILIFSISSQASFGSRVGGFYVPHVWLKEGCIDSILPTALQTVCYCRGYCSFLAFGL